MKYLILTLFFVVGTHVSAQKLASNFNTSRNWMNNKKEVYFAAGATQFLGDLGGRDQVGTQKSLADIDWAATRFGFGAGYRFRFHPFWATSTNLYFGLLSGDDAHTNELIRNSRNLHFRSQLIELSQRIEFILFANEQVGARYSLKGVKGMRSKADQIYLFTGIGGFFFNPQMRIDGDWTNLHPLKTEGQGLPGGPDEYSRFSASIPMGIGFKVALRGEWRIGMEVSYHLTFTDYIDDVSGNYYDRDYLMENIGPESAYASNPAKANHNWFDRGQQRGNPDDNDTYFLANIVLTRNLGKKMPRGPKWRGRPKY